MSFNLTPQLDADTNLVASLELSEVLLMNDPCAPSMASRVPITAAIR